jgi:serine/threonine protein phosphatase PrpC
MSYRWLSSSRTDRGRRRPTNEDAVLERPDAGVWVVADGMGGHTRGDIASRRIVEAFADIGPSRRLQELVAKSRLRLHQANERVFRESRSLGPQTTMGSTAVVLLASRDEFACLWVGDSRIYRYRDGELQQLTRDHSLLQELIDQGELSEAEALGHPSARSITRAVGAQRSVSIDEIRGELCDGDVFLLCSDGLPLEVASEEIASTLARRSHADATAALLKLSLERGARDNVSLTVVQFEEQSAYEREEDETTAINHTIKLTTTTAFRSQTTLSGY